MEFNPAAADVNQVFVEAPPNPEWTAATGTFKAIVLQSETAADASGAHTAQTASKPPTSKARAPGPPAARATFSSDEEDDIELDADFLSSTAEMRRLQLGLNDADADTGSVSGARAAQGARPGAESGPGSNIRSATGTSAAPVAKATPGSRAADAHPRAPTYAPADATPRSQPHGTADAVPRGQPHATADMQGRSSLHPAADAPRPVPHLSDTQQRPKLTQPDTHGTRARSTADTQSQLQPRFSQSSADSGVFPEPDVISRVPPRKTVKAFGLDSVEPPPEQLASLARSRIAPAALELEPPRRSIPGFLTATSPTMWTAGAGALLFLLVIQLMNHYRNELAATKQFNKPITALYSALGVHLTPSWDLHAYDVRQLGASVDAESAGQIMVRASIKNSGHQAQPMPLLRVTLQDRFGNRIAARDVPPGNYLPPAIPPTAFLSAGQRIDAEMAFVDPGANAVGFEIDACLPAPAGGIACANDPVSR